MAAMKTATALVALYATFACGQTIAATGSGNASGYGNHTLSGSASSSTSSVLSSTVSSSPSLSITPISSPGGSAFSSNTTILYTGSAQSLSSLTGQSTTAQSMTALNTTSATAPIGTGSSTGSSSSVSLSAVSTGSNATSALPGTGGLSSSTSSTTRGIGPNSNGTSTLIGTGASSSSSSSATSTVASNTTSALIGTGFSSTTSASAIVANNITLLPGAPLTSDGTTYLYTSSSEYINGSPTPLPTTTSGPPVTSTMTTVPSGLSTEIITDASFTTNGWLTTTGADSSSTILPLIVPCIGCAPIVVWDVPPIPDVEFVWPTFPQLPKFHLPCIKIFGITVAGDCPAPETDGSAPNPEEPTKKPSSSVSKTTATSSTASSSSSQSCTITQTASDCRVLCKPTPTSIGSFNTTTQSCSTSCYKTITGCSVTGQTTTTTATNSTITSSATVSVPACPRDTDEDSQLTVRAIQPVGNAWQRRAFPDNYELASTVTSLGSAGIGCALNAMTPAATPVTRPAYPKGAAMYTYDSQSLLVGTSDVARYVTVTSCPLAMKTNSFDEQTQAQDQNPYFFTTTDHGYEIHWLEDFFSYLLDNSGAKPNTLKCDAFQKYFFAKDKSNNTNRLTAVWNSLPSDDWMEGFALMTQYMNSFAKGTVANVPKMQSTVNNLLASKKAVTPKMQLQQGIKLVASKVDILKKLNVGCMTMNYAPVMQTIEEAWKRIYSSLKNVDNVVSCDLGVTDPLSVADSFVSYSNWLFNDANAGMNPQSRTLGQQLINNIESDLTAIKANAKYSQISDDLASQLAQQEAIFNLVKGTGSTSDASNTNWGVSFDPSALASSVNSKRDVSRRQACGLPQTSGDGSSTGGASATLTVGGSSTTAPANSSALSTTVQSNGTTTPTSTSSSSSTNLASAGISSSVNSTMSLATSTSSVSSTTAPPITSCALATQQATTDASLGLTLTSSQYCSCNNGWQAGLGSTVGSDQSTTFTCAVGSGTTIAVSTAAPLTTSTSTTPTSTTPTSTTPTATPTESCHTSYKLVLDTFDIYGADWDEAKLDGDGAVGSGQGLHDQISGCAEVTDWNYDVLTPTADSPWWFHASGHITIWQKSCIERAIVSAGAPEGSCSGSG